jgi:hypothetical protein
MAAAAKGLDKLVEESTYVFKATVTQLNASNEPAVRPGPGLIVAHVDEAFRASPSIGVRGLRGRDVTIQLSGGAPGVGEKLLVFANEWIYGTQIAVREVAHHKATAQAEKEVEEVVEHLPMRQLEARLDEAVLVVEGEVESIEPSPIPDGFSLHSPNYRLAVVRVGSVLKGKAGERVNILFPTNPAPPWRTAPRLKEGQNAVFILRHETALKAPHEFFTALDPHDVQSRETVSRIKSLLKS